MIPGKERFEGGVGVIERAGMGTEGHWSCFCWSFAVCAEEEVRGWLHPYLPPPELFLTKQHKLHWGNMEQLGNFNFFFFSGVVTHCNLPKVT